MNESNCVSISAPVTVEKLIDFRNGADRAFGNVTRKMQQQLAQAITQTEEDNLSAINELNDSLMAGTPGEMSDQSPSQPMATDQMGKRRKKSEDATGKKKKKKQTG
ncbi:unnamed protein product [Rhizophagus irregularis]|nr:unnamed protein product [Rhizophagus irregularis]